MNVLSSNSRHNKDSFKSISVFCQRLARREEKEQAMISKQLWMQRDFHSIPSATEATTYGEHKE